VGDQLAANEPVAVIHGNSEQLVDQALAMIQNAYTVGADFVADPLLGERL
jgi:thymidine phosphorylase